MGLWELIVLLVIVIAGMAWYVLHDGSDTYVVDPEDRRAERRCKHVKF